MNNACAQCAAINHGDLTRRYIPPHLTHTPPPFSPDLRAGEGETQSTIVLGNIAHSFLCSLHPRLTECHHNVSVVWGRGVEEEGGRGHSPRRKCRLIAFYQAFQKTWLLCRSLPENECEWGKGERTLERRERDPLARLYFLLSALQEEEETRKSSEMNPQRCNHEDIRQSFAHECGVVHCNCKPT